MVFTDVESFFFHHLEKGKIVTEIYMLQCGKECESFDQIKALSVINIQPQAGLRFSPYLQNDDGLNTICKAYGRQSNTPIPLLSDYPVPFKTAAASLKTQFYVAIKQLCKYSLINTVMYKRGNLFKDGK